jgi:hypothetical protein
VPWTMFISGKHQTHVLTLPGRLHLPLLWQSSSTLSLRTDMHEIGIVSGLAAAYQLRVGAKYPFATDKDCKRLFALYLGASHGSRIVRKFVFASASLLIASVSQRSEDRDGFFT